jgi:NAD(P)H dehydrogenase (quinone)
MSVKLAVVYYSSTGTLDAMAQRIAQAAEKAGAEVRLRHIAETAPREAIDSNEQWAAHVESWKGEPTAAPDDLEWADAVILGSPTRFGNTASQFQSFIDQLGPLWGEGRLADKVYAAFTASQTAHGGQESTLLALYTTIYHFGGFVVAPGYTEGLKFADGNPYGVSHVTGPDNDAPLDEPELAALDHLAERVVRATERLAG